MILPVVLFIGIGTLFRIGESNYHDAVCVIGMIAATPMMSATVNAILFGATVALLAIQLGASNLVALGLAAAAFVLGWALEAELARRAVARGPVRWEPRFPTPAK